MKLKSDFYSSRSGLIALLVFGNILVSTAHASAAHASWDHEQDARLSQAIERTLIHLNKTAVRKPFRFVAMNESLALTAEAGLQLQSGKISKISIEITQKATQLCPENAFALLLQGLFESTLGDQEASDKTLQRYLDKSLKLSYFDSQFTYPMEHHEIRRGVFELLKSRGLHPKLNPSTRAYFSDSFSHAKRHRTVLVILAGLGLFFILNHLAGADLKSGGWNFSIQLCSAGAAAYFIYFILDISHWKSRLSPAASGMLILSMPTLWLIFQGIQKWQREYGPIDANCQRCKKCRVCFSKLMMECPECKTPVV